MDPAEGSTMSEVQMERTRIDRWFRRAAAGIAAACLVGPCLVAVPQLAGGAVARHGGVSLLTLVVTRNTVDDLSTQRTTTNTRQFSSIDVQPDTTPENVDLTWGSPAAPGHLQVVSATPIVPGESYDVYHEFSDGAGGGCGLGYAGGLGSVRVDQISFSSGVLRSFAAHVSCSGGMDSVWGSTDTTVAYGITPTTPGAGYYLYEGSGQITGFGNDSYLSYLGNLSDTTLNRPVVGMATTSDGGGYWMVAGDGGVFGYGDAPFYGSMGGQPLNLPIVGMAADAATGGYWMVASDGGIFAFNAPFYGSMGGRQLNRPIVGMAATPDGLGYWLVASDGGVFAYGDAAFHGSTGSITLNRPVVGMAGDAATGGYWFVASDGGIFAFDAPFLGSMGGMQLSAPIVGMAASSTGGYWLTGSDGAVYGFGAPTSGGLAGPGAPSDVVGLTS